MRLVTELNHQRKKNGDVLYQNHYKYLDLTSNRLIMMNFGVRLLQYHAKARNLPARLTIV